MANFNFLIIPFLIGLIAAQKLNLLGEFYVGEAMAAAYIIVNIKKIRLSNDELKIISLAFLWALVQLVSDLANETYFFDALKGVLAPVVFVISFVFLMTYVKDEFSLLPSLLIGITVGRLVQLLIFPTEYFLFNFWKWGVGGVVIDLFVIYFSFFARRKNDLLLFAFLIVFLGITLYFDSRGMAILPVMATLAYKMYYGKSTSALSRLLSGKFVGFKVLLIALPMLFIVNGVASALFSSEAVLSKFSIATAAKYRTQATGSYGILLGGRSEVLVSAQAFLDRPLIGHGSWAKDRSGYLDRYLILRNKYGYSLSDDGGYEEVGEEVLIPAHSFLMGAMVWAGILGGIFWLVVLNSTLKIFIANLNLFPLYYYVGTIGFVWNIFFSPFGSDARWSTAVFLAAFFSFSNFLKSNARVVS